MALSGLGLRRGAGGREGRLLVSRLYNVLVTAMTRKLSRERVIFGGGAGQARLQEFPERLDTIANLEEHLSLRIDTLDKTIGVDRSLVSECARGGHAARAGPWRWMRTAAASFCSSFCLAFMMLWDFRTRVRASRRLSADKADWLMASLCRPESLRPLTKPCNEGVQCVHFNSAEPRCHACLTVLIVTVLEGVPGANNHNHSP